MSALTPPFAYFGGKTTLAPRIAELLPAHRHYVEPFGGSLAVLLAKPRSYMETVNDLDADLMTFWRVLRDQPDELGRVCALTPHSRQEQCEAYDRPDDLGDVERARRVWVCLTQGRGGQMKPTGWRHYVKAAGSTVSMPGYLRGYVERFGPAVARLADVSLESRPALELIERYGQSPDVLLYVDPPYLGSTRVSGGYRHEMRAEHEHDDLLDALLACRAVVVISGYASAQYDVALRDWFRVEMAASTGQGGTWANRTEVLWSNRSLDVAPGLWDMT